ncbi:MAG: transglutaminase domain-containing protein [Methanobacteriaceae archaeon]
MKITFLTIVFALLSLGAVSAEILDESVNQNILNNSNNNNNPYNNTNTSTNNNNNSIINSTINTNVAISNFNSSNSSNIISTNSSKNTNNTVTTAKVESKNTTVKAAAGDYKLTSLNQKVILAAALSIQKYIKKNGKLPNYIIIEGQKFSMPEFLYLITKTTYNINKKIKSNTTIVYGVGNPSKASGSSIKKYFTKSDYIGVANRIAKFISKGVAPNYAKTKVGKMQYQTLINAYVQILSYYKTYKKLPLKTYINIKNNSKLNKNLPKYYLTSTVININRVNILYKGDNEDLGEYLQSTKNCQVDDSYIQNLAKKITKGHSTAIGKAKAIFEWVKNTLSYSFYYNTKYGAKKTSTLKKGNCVDHAHLIVALSRASGIATRYVHGTCKFSSGNTYGHVWAQVLVDNKWVAVDATSSNNQFGVIKSWDINSFKLKGTHINLPF